MPGVTPGWCTNLLHAAQAKPGERVLVVVDEPLQAEAEELAEAAREAGAEAVVALWAGENRPLRHAPEAVIAEAERADLALHIQQAPIGEEGSARFELLEAMTGDGRNGRMIYMGLVDGDLLRGELSAPPADVAAAARTLLAELDSARTIRIRGRAGTDLTLRVEGRSFLTDAEPLEPGGFANYPGGEHRRRPGGGPDRPVHGRRPGGRAGRPALRAGPGGLDRRRRGGLDAP
jgi:hypothetical protein